MKSLGRKKTTIVTTASLYSCCFPGLSTAAVGSALHTGRTSEGGGAGVCPLDRLASPPPPSLPPSLPPSPHPRVPPPQLWALASSAPLDPPGVIKGYQTQGQASWAMGRAQGVRVENVTVLDVPSPAARDPQAKHRRNKTLLAVVAPVRCPPPPPPPPPTLPSSSIGVFNPQPPPLSLAPCPLPLPPRPPSGIQAPYLKTLQLRCLPATLTTPAQSLLHAVCACWRHHGRSAGALAMPTGSNADVQSLEAAIAAHLVGGEEWTCLCVVWACVCVGGGGGGAGAGVCGSHHSIE